MPKELTLEAIGAWHCEIGREPISNNEEYLEGYRKQYAIEQMQGEKLNEQSFQSSEA
tara:strand:- start:202 stop:372 length:171 start_codon:yes stop_codon:yes gene_type:complete